MKIIESLEGALHTSREEQEALQDAVSTTSKESRLIKRQLALLEGGTSSALGELVRERDAAAESINEAKKRLEATQKRLRHCEEDSERTHQQWAREKDAWDGERRKLERKIHIADTRLKIVLDEVAAFHAAEINAANGNGADSEAEEVGKDADGASVRTMSLTNSIRVSIMSGKLNGHSLADELNCDGDDDDETEYGGRDSVLSNHIHIRTQSRDSVMSQSHRRNQSSESVRRPGSVARSRFLNQAVLERLEGVVIHEDEDEEDQQISAPIAPVVPKVQYADSAVQYSPPPSPKLPPQTVSQPVPILERSPIQTPPPIPSRADRSSLHEATLEGPPRGDWGEIEANQRRKRVHIARSLTIEPVLMGSSLMVSVGSQTTTEVPLTPPKTPKSPPFDRGQSKNRASTGSLAEVPKPPPSPPPPQAVLVSSSTQTDPPPPPTPPLATLSPNGLVLLPQMAIPSISIHPPTSRPTTPREPLLPPLFKDFGCQVQLSSPSSYRSACVQTDEIRVDKRLDRLPAHLHPSAITSRPSSPGAMIVDPTAAAVDDLSSQYTPVPGYVPPPRNPRRLTARSLSSEPPSSPVASAGPALTSEETHDAYPGNNDDGPLSSQRAPVRRPHRISSLFAGFDGISSDEADDFMDGDLSDLEFRTALSAPKPKSGSSSSRTYGKRSPSVLSGTTSPDQLTSLPRNNSRSSARTSAMGIGGTESYYNKFPAHEQNRDNSRDFAPLRRGSVKSSRLSYDKGGSRSSVMRKAAMIQSGIATHQGRPRSPSLPEVSDPPFPIPTRASSRKPPISISAPSDGQRSPTRGDSFSRRGSSRGHYRVSSIRKVRSAAAIPVKPRNGRRGSRSPPRHVPFSADMEPGSPELPPLPINDVTASRPHYRAHQHQHRLSTTTANTEQTSHSGNQATGVVDAIAQTMVGEWMYKYVRRRKSFGGGDVSNRDDSSNDRHKRWVWLAPYERAILWSSKQPSNNSMLMGKSGRKRKWLMAHGSWL